MTILILGRFNLTAHISRSFSSYIWWVGIVLKSVDSCTNIPLHFRFYIDAYKTLHQVYNIHFTSYLFPNVWCDAQLYIVNVGAHNIIYLVTGFLSPFKPLMFWWWTLRLLVLSFTAEFTLTYEGGLSLKSGQKLVMELSYWLWMLLCSSLKMSLIT
jgi:hypothetical protein